MSISDTGSAQRQTVFISHANPEDNRVAARVAATLQSAGYRVWCDLQDALPVMTSGLRLRMCCRTKLLNACR